MWSKRLSHIDERREVAITGPKIYREGKSLASKHLLKNLPRSHEVRRGVEELEQSMGGRECLVEGG